MICLLKLIALILIVLSFSLAGRYFALLEKKREETLRSILLMVSVTETQLRYARLPVGDLLGILCENKALNRLGFLKACRELLCFGHSFSYAWKKSIEQNTELKKLLPEAYESLVALGGEIGATDLEGQLSRCEYHKRFFESILTQREEKSKRSAKLFPSLGLLLGVFAAIFML